MLGHGGSLVIAVLLVALFGGAKRFPRPRRLEIGDTAGWKPALPWLRAWRRCGWLLRGFLLSRCRTRGQELSTYKRAAAGRAIGSGGPAGRDCCLRPYIAG